MDRGGSPFLQWYAQEARNYSLLILCACVSTALLLRIRRRPGAAATAGYLLATAAGMLSNLSFAFLAPLHAAFWIGPRAGRPARLRRAGLIAAGLALIAAPWAMEAAGLWDWNRLSPVRATPVQEAPLRGATTFHAGALPFAAYAFSVGYSSDPRCASCVRGTRWPRFATRPRRSRRRRSCAGPWHGSACARPGVADDWPARCSGSSSPR